MPGVVGGRLGERMHDREGPLEVQLMEADGRLDLVNGHRLGRQAAELTERAAGLVEPAERQQGLDQGLERQNPHRRVAPLASTAERRDFAAAS